MILYEKLNLKQIFKKGKRYPWEHPERCPRCTHYKLWGHGYAQRLFDGFMQTLFMKCYRCPACGCVVTLRPLGYFARIQAPIAAIRSALSRRLRTGRWPPGGSRSRQRHWLAHLRRNVSAHLTNTWSRGDLAGFDRLRDLGIVPVCVRIA
jgi:hypothetical protein